MTKTQHMTQVEMKFHDFMFPKKAAPSNLHQIPKVRSVLKSAGSDDFKTALDCEFWSSRS